MTSLQLLFAAGFPAIAVPIGGLLNRSDANGIRSELAMVRSDLSGSKLPGKVIELTGRVSHLEARIGK